MTAVIAAFAAFFIFPSFAQEPEARYYRGFIESLRPLAIDEYVDVPPERRAGLAQAVAQARPPGVELIEHVAHRGRLELEAARQAGEQRLERRGESDVGHAQASTTAVSTDTMLGR